MIKSETSSNTTVKKSFFSYIVGLSVFMVLFIVIQKQNELSIKIKEDEQIKIEKKAKEKKALTVAEKKQMFITLMIKPLKEVYDEEMKEFERISEVIESNDEDEELIQLKKKYRVQTNDGLLMALKPHPKSIALAQAAMESAWGESRFFQEANNIFGVWSFNKNEPRIAAGSLRGDKTIWLKKYPTIKAAIKDYYLLLSRSGAFKDFRKLNYEKEHQNPYLLVKKLHRYSEKKELYGKELTSMISYNKLVKFDEVHYKRFIPKDANTQKQDKILNEAMLQKESATKTKEPQAKPEKSL